MLQTRILATAAVMAIALAAGTAQAATINFEEFPADNANGTMPANRYAYLGVTFVGTDDGTTFSGISEGDPGAWGLQGTNGGRFMGFNGSSYAITMQFSSLMGAFSLDAARSGGSSNGVITIEAFLGGSSVGANSVSLGGINQWSTLNLAGSFDSVRISGAGTGFHPFGIDNINFSAGAVPEPATWAMMIGGFALAGAGMRRRNVALRYA